MNSQQTTKKIINHFGIKNYDCLSVHTKQKHVLKTKYSWFWLCFNLMMMMISIFLFIVVKKWLIHHSQQTTKTESKNVWHLGSECNEWTIFVINNDYYEFSYTTFFHCKHVNITTCVKHFCSKWNKKVIYHPKHNEQLKHWLWWSKTHTGNYHMMPAIYFNLKMSAKKM